MDPLTISGIADKAATAQGIPADGATPTTPVVSATPEPTAVTPATPVATVPPATPTEPPTKYTLDELRTAMQEGKIKPEELAFANPKLQSSFGKLQARAKAVETAVAAVLDDKGVILPEGKTVADVMNEPDGGKAFMDLLRGTVAAEMKPFKQAQTAEELKTEISDRLQETVTAFPDIESYLPEIGKIIKENPLLEEACSAPRFIPLVLTGVARDLQYQKAEGERVRLETENTRLKGVLKAAEEAATMGTSTSRAATTPTPTTTAGATENVRALAESLFDKAQADAKGSIN